MVKAFFNEWRGGQEAGDRGAGAVGVGGCVWLRWPVVGLPPGACPRLGFAARGRCGPSPGVLRGWIYFRRGCRRRLRGACPGRGCRHGLASPRGLLLAESVLRAAAAAGPTVC